MSLHSDGPYGYLPPCHPVKHICFCPVRIPMYFQNPNPGVYIQVYQHLQYYLILTVLFPSSHLRPYSTHSYSQTHLNLSYCTSIVIHIVIASYFIINNLVKNTSIFFLFLHYLVFFFNWLHNIKGIYSFFPL